MLLNEDSSREDILKYIKETSFSFLHDFSHKPWAQPYLDEVAKEAARENPEYFLEKWADRFPQYINTALFALGE